LSIEEINASKVRPVQIVEAPPPLLQAEPEPGLPKYEVSAILYGRSGNRVVIDSRVLREGDTIGLETVKEIKQGAVILEYGGRTRELRLKRFEDAVKRPATKGEKQ
jgi:hypothetical protein